MGNFGPRFSAALRAFPQICNIKRFLPLGAMEKIDHGNFEAVSLGVPENLRRGIYINGFDSLG